MDHRKSVGILQSVTSDVYKRLNNSWFRWLTAEGNAGSVAVIPPFPSDVFDSNALETSFRILTTC